jgi:ribosomal-protein-alanine N-acetyltransferase
MIDIIPMKFEHISGVHGIEEKCFMTPWTKEAFEKELTENQLAFYIVAMKENQVIGYAGMWIIIDEGHITNIAVLPELQGKKIGSLLVEALVEEAKKRQLVGLTLEVRKSNEKAQKLYFKYGFEESGIRKNYYQDMKEDAVIMWRYL